MKKAVIRLSVFALILNSCGGTSNKQTDKNALADSLFIRKLTEHELITSRYIMLIGDSDASRIRTYYQKLNICALGYKYSGDLITGCMIVVVEEV